MQRNFFAAVLALFLSLPGLSLARVVGQDGQVYDIAEQDFREVISAKASAFDYEGWSQQEGAKIRERVKNFRLPDSVSGLPPAVVSEVYRVDMSYRVPQDIKDIQGNVVYPAGYVFNVLELMEKRKLHYTGVLVVINAERKVELEWFKVHFNKSPNVKLLITDGKAYVLGEELKRPVYYLTDLIKSRFAIKATPSVVLQPAKSKYMAVKTFALQDEADPAGQGADLEMDGNGNQTTKETTEVSAVPVEDSTTGKSMSRRSQIAR